MKAYIQSFLPAEHPWRERIIWFDEIDSTNTQAKLLAKAGAPHGTVLIADRQTGGRGRMGRSFCSPAGMGIYLSAILRPQCHADQLMHLTCAVAVAMCDAVEEVSGFRPGIKWINDLLAKDKKLGGILTELSFSPGTTNPDFAVVGIGINCSQSPSDFPEELQDIAISLKTATGTDPDRFKLTAAMIQKLHQIDRYLLTGKGAAMRQYKTDCVTLGQEIYLLRGGEKIPCTALDLTPDGALIVKHLDGNRETVQSGEVSVRSRQ